MLILFVLVISIVLTNLFIGLIVGDVEKINRMAETKKWKLNLEFIEYTGEKSTSFEDFATLSFYSEVFHKWSSFIDVNIILLGTRACIEGFCLMKFLCSIQISIEISIGKTLRCKHELNADLNWTVKFRWSKPFYASSGFRIRGQIMSLKICDPCWRNIRRADTFSSSKIHAELIDFSLPPTDITVEQSGFAAKNFFFKS